MFLAASQWEDAHTLNRPSVGAQARAGKTSRVRTGVCRLRLLSRLSSVGQYSQTVNKPSISAQRPFSSPACLSAPCGCRCPARCQLTFPLPFVLAHLLALLALAGAGCAHQSLTVLKGWTTLDAVSLSPSLLSLLNQSSQSCPSHLNSQRCAPLPRFPPPTYLRPHTHSAPLPSSSPPHTAHGIRPPTPHSFI